MPANDVRLLGRLARRRRRRRRDVLLLGGPHRPRGQLARRLNYEIIRLHFFKGYGLVMALMGHP